MRIYTIGGYGFTKDSFESSLVDHKIDAFIDIRQRRGVRGKKYSFLNSRKLQDNLSAINIKYIHKKELAPTKEIREMQKRVDRSTGTLKKSRKFLSEEFQREYEDAILNKVDLKTMLADLKEKFNNIVFFCVETEPKACHRSVVVRKISSFSSFEIEDIMPKQCNDTHALVMNF